MELLDFEKIIIKFLFSKENLRDKALSFIKPEIFDDFLNIGIIKKVQEFETKIGRFPQISELKIEFEDQQVHDRFIEILNLDISDYKDDYLIIQCENFIKIKLSIIYNIECVQKLKEDKFDDAKLYPDLLRSALSFSFDDKIGLALFEDADRMYNFLHNKDKTISYGIKFLDQFSKGGAHEKSLVIFMAESNLGKSLILCSLCTNAILQNHKPLYISGEMSEELISNRIIANIWNTDINELDLINKEIFYKRYKEMQDSIKGRVITKEYPPACKNVNDVRNLLKELEIKAKYKPDVIFLDYIELFKPTYQRKSDNTYTSGKVVAEEFRALSIEYKIPIITAIQTNRQGYGSAELSLKHIADSLGVAFTADVVVAVTQVDELRAVNKFSMMFLKNRFGVNKERGLVGVDKSKMRIFDCEDSDISAIKNIMNNPDDKILIDAMEIANNHLDTKEKIQQEDFIVWE